MARHSGVQTLTPEVDPVPGNHTQCCRKGIGAVCRVVLGAGQLNPATEVQGQVGKEGAREACTDPVAVSEFVVAVAVFFAAVVFSAAAVESASVVVAVDVSAVAAAGSVTSAAAVSVFVVACADAAGPEPPPYSQSGQRAHGLDFLPASGLGLGLELGLGPGLGPGLGLGPGPGLGPGLGPGPAASSVVAEGTKNHM